MKPHLCLNVPLLIAAALSFSGCATAPSHAGNGSSATVVMQFHSFEPKTITINAGETVQWQNKSLIWHTVTANPALAKKPEDASLPQGAEPFDSGKVDAGGNYQHTFTIPGTYRYFCKPHEMNGMVGEIVVNPRRE